MWEKFMEANTGVNVIWCIGVLGVLFRIMAYTYLCKMVRASQSMATTRRKKLRIIRQKFENRKNLNMGFATGEACVDKCIGQLRFIGRPLSAWSHTGQLFRLLICMVMAGGFIYYDIGWHGSPDMIYFLANGTLVCALLMTIENIFVINNKLEMLKANIWDYYETMFYARESLTRRLDNGMGKGSGSKELSQVSDRERAEGEYDGRASNQDEVLLDGEAAKQSAATSVYDARASNQSEVLESFLREFFT